LASAHTHRNTESKACCVTSNHITAAWTEKKRKEKKRKEKKRKEKTTPFGINIMRSQVLYRAAQRPHGLLHWALKATDPL